MDLSNHWAGLASIFAASFVAFLSPGPNFVAIVSSAVDSRRLALAVAAGVSIGTAFWALMAVTGLSSFLKLYPAAGIIMQLLGGSYFVYLGTKALRGALAAQSTKLAGGQGVGQGDTIASCFIRGLTIQLTNPKTAVFWLSMVSSVITSTTPFLVAAILVFGTTLIAFVWHSFLAVSFSQVKIAELYLRFKPYISGMLGIAFVTLGLRVLYLAWMALRS